MPRLKLSEVNDFNGGCDVMLMRPQDLPFDLLEEAASLLWQAEWAAGHDRIARGFGAEQKSCYACKADPIAVEFVDFDHGGYPRNRWRLAARLVCEEHAGEAAYWAHLNGAIEPAPSWSESWEKHLCLKRWFDPTFGAELRAAEKMWQERAARIEARAVATAKTKRLAELRRQCAPTSNPRSISTALRTFVLERDSFKCRRCGCGPDDARLVVDHIKPVAKGGTADPENLQTLCWPCNAAKSDRDPHEHDLRGRRG